MTEGLTLPGKEGVSEAHAGYGGREGRGGPHGDTGLVEGLQAP